MLYNYPIKPILKKIDETIYYTFENQLNIQNRALASRESSAQKVSVMSRFTALSDPYTE